MISTIYSIGMCTKSEPKWWSIRTFAECRHWLSEPTTLLRIMMFLAKLERTVLNIRSTQTFILIDLLSFYREEKMGTLVLYNHTCQILRFPAGKGFLWNNKRNCKTYCFIKEYVPRSFLCHCVIWDICLAHDMSKCNFIERGYVCLCRDRNSVNVLIRLIFSWIIS